MGYMHLENLYKEQGILLFKECYALEKIHGTSANINMFTAIEDNKPTIRFSSGGEKHNRFIGLFDEEELLKKYKEKFMASEKVILFGEAYGGAQQGMKETYGEELRFIVFDVKIGSCWLSVPQAEDVTKYFGLEFVSYNKISTDLKDIDAERDRDSEQAIRNGIGKGKIREGVVLRPLIELTKNNGSRLICKHKRDEFKETTTKREVSPEELKVLEEAQAIADEWVTAERLRHVLDKVDFDIDITNTGKIIKAMIQDVYREGKDEIVESHAATKAIGRNTATMFKKHLQEQIGK